jgi:hypothetical protein
MPLIRIAKVRIGLATFSAVLFKKKHIPQKRRLGELTPMEY